MKLYEIDAAIMDCIDLETGEVVDAEKLTPLQMEREQKVENVALWVKDLDAEAKAIRAEEQSFAERRRALESKAESLRSWLASALNGEKFGTTKVAITFRRTKSVQVDDVFKLDDEFVKYAEPKPDKAAIKKALEAGQTIEGAELVENLSMSIK